MNIGYIVDWRNIVKRVMDLDDFTAITSALIWNRRRGIPDAKTFLSGKAKELEPLYDKCLSLMAYCGYEKDGDEQWFQIRRHGWFIAYFNAEGQPTFKCTIPRERRKMISYRTFMEFLNARNGREDPEFMAQVRQGGE